MGKRSIENRAEDLLTLAGKLAETPGLTWVEANNAIYGPGGPYARLFPSAKDRTAFANTEASRRIDELIDSLPEPPVGRSGANTAVSSMSECPNRSTPRWPARRKRRE